MEDKRREMVYDIKEKYGLKNPEILSVMLQIPRHNFVDKEYWNIAYDDGPVPLGYGQTMSQPYTVAFMTDLLDLTGKEKVLEIGTGSGYQAAVLSKLAKEVYTVEIIAELANKATDTLKKLEIENVYIKKGSGEFGWPEKAPYDAIIITAGLGEDVPQTLFNQLNEGGILVAPVGEGQDKKMTRFIKSVEEINKEEFGTFHFVPFVESN